MGSGIDGALFNMKTSPLFCQVCVAAVLAMRRSQKAGIGVKTKKVGILLLYLVFLKFLKYTVTVFGIFTREGGAEEGGGDHIEEF
jgi:hypothetical protein